MCWIGDDISKIAKEPITTYKIVQAYNNEYISIYNYFIYKIDKMYGPRPLVKANTSNFHTTINIGFHSYKDFTVQESKNKELLYIYSRMIILDAFTVKQAVTTNLVKVECIIPKGSIYYINNLNEIVSECIILTGNKTTLLECLK